MKSVQPIGGVSPATLVRLTVFERAPRCRGVIIGFGQQGDGGGGCAIAGELAELGG